MTSSSMEDCRLVSEAKNTIASTFAYEETWPAFHDRPMCGVSHHGTKWER